MAAKSVNTQSLADNTPIIVGAGQYVERIRQTTRPSFDAPMTLASFAAQKALKDTGTDINPTEIDTIAVVRLFSDSTPTWKSPFGSSNNPPESIAQQIGANPQHRIYSEVGGTQPLQLLLEMSHAIASGEKSLVLLAGAEAIGFQKYGQRNNIKINWQQDFDVDLDDRGYGKKLITEQEIANGLQSPALYYSLIENYRAHQQGHDERQHQRFMAELFAPFSKIAASNRFSHSMTSYTADDIASASAANYLLTAPYRKYFVAQDAVNQSSALILTSVGKARSLNIKPSQWIFINGFAEGHDHYLSQRPDIGRSEIMKKVIDDTMSMANISPNDIDLFDIYSCFPCAVSTVCDVLKLPTDGSIPLTVTGGLPFFGGPGNNYSMHALATMTAKLKKKPLAGLITANGGMLSKHAAVVLGSSPESSSGNRIDWDNSEINPINADAYPDIALADQPTSGKIISYTISYPRKANATAIVIGETNDSKQRFVASSSDDNTITSFEAFDNIGRSINLEPQANRNQFTLTNG